jgi:hypothetical protein
MAGLAQTIVVAVAIELARLYGAITGKEVR